MNLLFRKKNELQTQQKKRSTDLVHKISAQHFHELQKHFTALDQCIMKFHRLHIL